MYVTVGLRDSMRLVACASLLAMASCIPDATLVPADAGAAGAGGATGADAQAGAAGATPGCEDKTVSADFTTSFIGQTDITISPDLGFHFTSAYSYWEYDYATGHMFDGQFAATVSPLSATLTVAHLSS